MTYPTAKCAQCGCQFTVLNAGQLGAFRKGLAVYCCASCRVKMGIAKNATYAPHEQGPCPTCGRMFRSRTKEKTFCCLDCYLKSDRCRERLKENNNNKKLPTKACPHCGKEIPGAGKRYCSTSCRRRYFSERFDRFIANPERIALPQNYDEFLVRETLPCLVDGCEWEGQNLSYHMNVVHGVPKDQFKALAGFNQKTGVVGIGLHEKMSISGRSAIQAGRRAVPDRDGMSRLLEMPKDPRYGRSLEAKEHHRKAMAVRSEDQPTKMVTCDQCDKDFVALALGNQKFCCVSCRNRFYAQYHRYTLSCSHCGEAFLGSKSQYKSARRGNPVVCSQACRNHMNMVKCLAKRGIVWNPERKQADGGAR